MNFISRVVEKVLQVISATGIYSVCARHWTFAIRMYVKQDTKKENGSNRRSARHERKLLKVFL